MARPPRSGNHRYLAAVLAAALPLLCALATPIGATGQNRPPGEASAAFTVHGSNGFTLDVESEAKRVALIVSEHAPPVPSFSPGGMPRHADGGNGASSTYLSRGLDAAHGRVTARLGRLGRIAVSFHPSGKVRVSQFRPGTDGCERPALIVRRLGTFTGTIAFEGEGGYTKVEATSARGSVGTPMPRSCRDRPLGAAPRPEEGSAELEAFDRHAGVRFRATTTDRGAAFVALLRERSPEGVVVTRRAFAGAPPSTFTFDRGLTRARVKPPAPFLGTAGFSAARPDRWSGNLTATFPGRTVAMTGPGFRASLRGRR
jgi:hypothetical protein